MKATTIPTNQEVYQRLLEVLPQLSRPLIETLEYDYKHLQEFEGNIKEFVRDRIDVIEESCRLINRDAVRIAFCGYFSSGKTSLINKLLGSNTLRVTAGEESGVSCFIMKGESDSFFLSYFSENNDNPEIQEVSYEDFKRKTSMSELGDGQFDAISSAHVTLNNPNIPENIIWIDTAGLTSHNNQSKIARMTQAIADADVIVWLCKSGGSGGFLAETEQDFLKSLINRGFYLNIYLINNINIEVNNWQDWLDNTEEEIQKSIQNGDKFHVGNTTMDKEWQQLFTEDVLYNKKEIVAEAFHEYVPIIPTIDELEKLYEEPYSERTQLIVNFIHSRKPVHVQLHSFSTFRKCTHKENEISFEYFRNQINLLNNKEHLQVYNSRIAKIKILIKDHIGYLQEYYQAWLDKVLEPKKESLISIEKTLQNEINNSFIKHFDKAIIQLENYKNEAMLKFEQSHKKLIKDYNYMLSSNGLNNHDTSSYIWNTHVKTLREEYLFYENDAKKEYSYNSWERGATYSYRVENQTQTINNSIIDDGENSGKGQKLTREMIFQYVGVLDKIYPEVIKEIYINLYVNYFPHLVENTDWFDGRFLANINNFIENVTYKSLFPPFKRIYLGYIPEDFVFWNQNKLTVVVNAEKSIEKTKASITEAYDNYINYLKNIKKCKIEEDKTAFLNIFKEEYLGGYYQIKEMLEESIDKSSNLFSELQLHSIIRP